MTDSFLVGVSEADRKALPTLSQLSENDVYNIWASVSAFIERQMSLQKGVCIPGLGLFTFSQQKLDMGSKYVLIQRPIFLLAEKLSHLYGLKQNKPLAAAGDIPVVQLNFSALSMDSPFERDVVEGCVREMLLLLLRAVSGQRSGFLIFRGIGVLSFHHGTVKMKFYRDFISAMDGTGTLLWALTNRPGTSTSVVSGRLSDLQRPRTSNAIMLPKIPLEDLTEEEKDGAPSTNLHDKQKENGNETQHSVLPKTRLVTPKPNGIISPESQEIKSHSDTTERRAGTSQPLESAAEKVEKGVGANSSLVCHNHTRAGQELCYLCMQRAQRNVPLYLAAERQRENKKEERVLLLAETHKVDQYLQQEQAKQKHKREENQKIAEFNLEVSELLKAKKIERPSVFEDSYIFKGRPLTPPRLLKQRHYMQVLSDQLTEVRKSLEKNLEEQELCDRLHQVQLADELAKHRAQEFLEKKENIKKLQKALDTQLEIRSPRIPARQPNSDFPVFGVMDRDSTALAEQKQRAQTVSTEQQNAASIKKQEAVYNKLSEQKRELEMLQSNHKELIADQITRHEKLRNVRASLEDTWRHSAGLKRFRDLEEQAFIRSGGRLLLDQCVQYRRCFQCKRKQNHFGENNHWKQSHYIPGSRLIVQPPVPLS